MSRRQRIVLVVVSLAIAGTLLFPPFHFEAPDGLTVNMGYAFILTPPATPFGSSDTPTVDAGMLLTQWVGILTVGFLVVVAMREVETREVPKS